VPFDHPCHAIVVSSVLGHVFSNICFCQLDIRPTSVEYPYTKEIRILDNTLQPLNRFLNLCRPESTAIDNWSRIAQIPSSFRKRLVALRSIGLIEGTLRARQGWEKRAKGPEEQAL
jgi:hypothetical protein